MKKKNDSTQLYSDKQGDVLIQLARQTIAERIGRKMSKNDISDALKDKKFMEHQGTFVTLNKNGQLRGCIGNLTATESVLDGIKRNAVNAAFHDHRFPPLALEELDEVSIEVSILTDPKPLEYEDGADLSSKLQPKKDGVIINKGAARATFLPQVWEQLPEPEEFLNHLCMKAGLPGDAWQIMKLGVLTYQVQYFEEKK